MSSSGANGSGKSNFIGVFTFLHAMREARLQDYVAQGGRRRQSVALRLEDDGEARFAFRFKDGH
jgi:predicted ATPase